MVVNAWLLLIFIYAPELYPTYVRRLYFYINRGTSFFHFVFNFIVLVAVYDFILMHNVSLKSVAYAMQWKDSRGVIVEVQNYIEPPSQATGQLLYFHYNL